MDYRHLLRTNGGPRANPDYWDFDSYSRNKFSLLGAYGLLIIFYAFLMSLLAVALSHRKQQDKTPLDKAIEAAKEFLLERFKRLLGRKK